MLGTVISSACHAVFHSLGIPGTWLPMCQQHPHSLQQCHPQVWVVLRCSWLYGRSHQPLPVSGLVLVGVSPGSCDIWCQTQVGAAIVHRVWWIQICSWPPAAGVLYGTDHNFHPLQRRLNLYRSNGVFVSDVRGSLCTRTWRRLRFYLTHSTYTYK